MSAWPTQLNLRFIYLFHIFSPLSFCLPSQSLPPSPIHLHDSPPYLFLTFYIGLYEFLFFSPHSPPSLLMSISLILFCTLLSAFPSITNWLTFPVPQLIHAIMVRTCWAKVPLKSPGQFNHILSWRRRYFYPERFLDFLHFQLHKKKFCCTNQSFVVYFQ